MTPLNRKLVRDLLRLKGQVLAVGLVVASGVGMLIMSLGMIRSLSETTTAYYERYNFADVFATVRRAPERLTERIAAIDGVQTVESRIKKFATLDIEGFDEPVLGHLVSIPERGRPALNRLVIRAGRRIEPGRPDEVVVSEPFAEEHGLAPGSTFSAVINGHWRRLTVVGIALSPEFVYSIGPGFITPDDKRFGIIWMGRDALAAAYDLDGAFNNVTVTLLRGANAKTVIDRLDVLLDPYGSTGALPRSEQISNWFLSNEITQLKTIAGLMPTIFLAVAAFLANMVLGRLISVERSEIGLLKAFGYSDWAVGWHYAKLVMLMTGCGILIGWVVGYFLGRYTTGIYTEFFRFPFLYYEPGAGAFVTGALVSLAATLAGAANAVRKAVKLPPAEAMRPPSPPLYRSGAIGPRWMGKWVDQPTRAILRQVLRWPIRSFMTSFGIGMAIALLVMSNQWFDSVDHQIDVHFFRAQHQNVTVSLEDARSTEILQEFSRLPGVMMSEGQRSIPVRMHNGVNTHRGSIEGIRPDARLSLVYDTDGGIIRVPREGLVLSRKLAEKLRVGVGDEVTVEVLERRRPIVRLPVVRVFKTYIGTPAYMNFDALSALMRERDLVNMAHLLVDPAREATLYDRLKDMPVVTTVLLRGAAVQTFHETIAETLTIYVTIFVGFGCALTFGVVYNSARIALSERGRELATLRVLGFSRFEISYILLGEIAVLTIAALPIGALAGRALSLYMTEGFDTELYRIPSVIELSTYGISILIGLAATIVSAMIVRGRLDNLDLIAVLKTRE